MTSAPSTAPALAPLAMPLYDRWVLAARIAHRLSGAAAALGGFATAEIRVALGDEPPRRPAVAVVACAPPVDPVVRVPPLLVVELAPACAPAHWLERGVGAVWSVGRDVAWVHRAGRPPVRVAPPGVLELAVAGVDLRLALPVEGDPPATGGSPAGPPGGCARGAEAMG